MNVHVVVFRDVTQCRNVIGYQRLEGPCSQQPTAGRYLEPVELGQFL